MPRTVQKTPTAFCEEIRCLRIQFSELVNIFETMDIDQNKIHATSSNAEFEGLDDIKSAPTRFSGEPSVVISRHVAEDVFASAKIEFKNENTIISAGEYGRYGAFNEEDDELAKSLYEELKPYSSLWEFWVSRIANWVKSTFFYLWGGCLLLIFLRLVIYTYLIVVRK